MICFKCIALHTPFCVRLFIALCGFRANVVDEYDFGENTGEWVRVWCLKDLLSFPIPVELYLFENNEVCGQF